MKTLLKRMLPHAVSSRLGAFLRKVRGWYLRRFESDFSQSGETVAVRQILRGLTKPVFVEIGANDGVTVSTTYGLVRDGWSGLSVEANPRVFENLRRNLTAFPRVTTVCCAASPQAGPVKLFLGNDDPSGLLSTISTEDSAWYREKRSAEFVEVPGLPLTNLLAQHQIPKRFELLLVDTEGMDLEILQTLDFSQFRPRLIITEDYESKNAQKVAFLESVGYVFRRRIGCNTFWLDTRDEVATDSASGAGDKAAKMSCGELGSKVLRLSDEGAGIAEAEILVASIGVFPVQEREVL